MTHEHEIVKNLTASDTTPHNTFNNCKYCKLANVCMPLSLPSHAINTLAKHDKIIHKGHVLFSDTTPFNAIYAVRSGSLKTTLNGDANQAQITGFYLPGDIMGLDGIATNIHTNHAVALETTAVCAIPFSALEQYTLNTPALQRPFLQLMSQEINTNQTQFMQHSQKNAEQKIAGLLTSIAVRFKHQGFSHSTFTLPMSRADMANFLGLTVETISRVLTKLSQQGYLAVDKKNISQLDLSRLAVLSKS